METARQSREGVLVHIEHFELARLSTDKQGEKARDDWRAAAFPRPSCQTTEGSIHDGQDDKYSARERARDVYSVFRECQERTNQRFRS